MDVLDCATDLDAGHVLGQIEPKDIARQQALQMIVVRSAAGEGEGGGQPGRYVLREPRSGHQRWLGGGTGDLDRRKRAETGPKVDPLAAGDQCSAVEAGAMIGQHTSQCLHRDGEKHRSLPRGLDGAGHRDGVRQSGARQLRAFATLGNGRRIAGPERDVVSSPVEDQRQRRAEGPCAENGDLAHALAPFLPRPSMGVAAASRGHRGRAEKGNVGPASSSAIAAQAIIAALSAQSAIGGATNWHP